MKNLQEQRLLEVFLLDFIQRNLELLEQEFLEEKTSKT